MTRLFTLFVVMSFSTFAIDGLMTQDACLGSNLECGALYEHDPLPSFTNMSDISANERAVNLAVLQIVNSLEKTNITVWYQYEECYKCRLIKGLNVKPSQSIYSLIDTRWKTLLLISHGSNVLCNESHISTHFYEGGNYKIWVSRNNSHAFCIGPVLMNSPPNAYSPIFAALAIFIFLILTWTLIKYLHSRHFFRHFMPKWLRNPECYDLGLPPQINEADSQSSSVNTMDTKPRKERLRSLDTFRGFSLVTMIFVNYGGGGYWFFHHSPWNGLTVADLVFPWFVFIMGTSITLSFASNLNRGLSKKRLYYKIIKRSVILFGLGLLLNSYGSGTSLYRLRIPGVLQRLALTYLIVSSIHLIFIKTHLITQVGAPELLSSIKYSRFSVRDVTKYWIEWLIHLCFVIIYLSLTFALPVPNCPIGYTGAGGLEDGGAHQNCTGGAAGYIDRVILSDRHIYQWGTAKQLYHTTVPYDPEGILGTLTSCLICFLGLQAGKILLIYKDSSARLVRWLCWSFVCCLLATILCKGSQNSGWIPINKNLWSLSFVLLMAGFAFLVLTFCYVLVDLYKLWSGAPFTYPGVNPITVYVMHELFHYLFTSHFVGYRSQHWSILFMNLFGVSVWVMLAYTLYLYKIFITI